MELNEEMNPRNNSGDISTNKTTLTENVTLENNVKINGDHSLEHSDLQNDDSCSTSSSSSHNLVIDHPDDLSSDQDGYEESKNKKSELKDATINSNILKRKLSNIDRDSPERKQPHLTKENLSEKTETTLTEGVQVIEYNLNIRKDNLEVATNNIRPGELLKIGGDGEGQFQEYAQYLGLKPTVKYKCFKCYNYSYDTLDELRVHQKVCLFKDNHKSSHDFSSIDIFSSSNSSHISLDNIKKSRRNVQNDTQAKTFLEQQHANTKTTAKAKKKVFLCAACGTYYENWNLFLHMREVHKRHICLYCIGMFPTAERLTLHLEMKHDLEQNHFDCQEKLLRSSRDACYLMCCICEHLFTEHEDFSDHNCNELIAPCLLCGQKGRHSPRCKSFQGGRSSKHREKQKQKKNEKFNKETILSESKTDMPSHFSNAFIDSSRLEPSDYICDKKRTKVDNRSRWKFKVNGRVNENGSKINTKSNEATSPIKKSKHLKLDSEPVNVVKDICENGNSKEDIASCVLENIQNLIDNNTKIAEETCNSNQNDSNDVSKHLHNDHNELPMTILEEKSENTSSTVEQTTTELVNIPQHTEEEQSNVATEPINDNHEEKPLLVPKFKIKVPKEYQKPLESEHSSTESENEEIEHANKDQIPQEAPIDTNINQGSDAIADTPAEDLDDVDGSKNQSLSEDINKTVEETSNLETNKTDTKEPSLALPTPIPTPTPAGSPLATSISTATPVSTSTLELEPVSAPQPLSIPESLSAPEPLAVAVPVPLAVAVPVPEPSPAPAPAPLPLIEEEEEINETPSDGIEVANDDVPIIELFLDWPIDKIAMMDFLRICLRATYPLCLYCNHARRIAVNGHSLALHMIGQHRFSATVNSITAEELLPTTIVAKMKSFLPDLNECYFNLENYSNTEKLHVKICEKIFECFFCRFQTRIHKELYLHNRKMHLKTAILCFMCRANFFSYSEILCHMCPGAPNKCIIFDIKFRCCFCELDEIPSAFRLMVHLRKKHSACDVCLEDCQDQSRLSSHVWKHKLHHLCYRCGIAYRNKPDITKHLFWKHGTESVLCKRCLQKRWPHVYHFCIPPSSFVCETCNLAFSKAMCLKVHKRLHTLPYPYPCTEDNCDKKFISRKLLLKHVTRHMEISETKVNEPVKEEDKEDLQKKGETEEEKVNIEQKDVKKASDTHKKKKKKVKKEQKGNLDDLMNLPAPNLSESDSSDESGNEKRKLDISSPHVPEVMLSPPSDNGEEEKNTNSSAIIDVWENFRTFQANQAKHRSEELEDSNDAPPVPLLHVNQSDHDYCSIYKPLTKDSRDETDEKVDGIIENKESTIENSHNLQQVVSPKKKQKSPRKNDKSGSDSSSSGSSSSSDSSCSCGPNCSCSSSSGTSSGSSSSSEDSDSSTSEGRRRIAAKKAAKEEKRRNKSDNSSKANGSDVVDVVNSDVKAQDINPDSIILESDLETDESFTDEDFYDEHPQKLATQMLAEKRRQLMLQTCMSPSHTFDIVENSTPSTPSLPEEVVKEKKVKIKKKKREKRASKNNSFNTFKVNIPNVSTPEVKPLPPEAIIPTIDILPKPPIMTLTPPIATVPVPTVQSAIITAPLAIPAPIAPKNRLSTGSSSDADAPLKRSKRARRPNKFYGYSSDDDSMAPVLIGAAAFKPTPPPNLTWRKEDLPTPSKSLVQKVMRGGSNASRKKELSNTLTPPPPIPPIIIRPSGFLSRPAEQLAQRPPIIENARVPPVPVHHIQPPQYYPSSKESIGSESSDEDKLHIPVPSYKMQSQMQSQTNFMTTSIQKPLQTVQPQVTQRIPPALLPNPDASLIQYFKENNIRYPIQPPAGARPPREGESVYCYCRCPYDEVSEMIACDGDNCMIEWFHFECVGIMVPPQGKWFCPECRPKYPNELVDTSDGT